MLSKPTFFILYTAKHAAKEEISIQIAMPEAIKYGLTITGIVRLLPYAWKGRLSLLAINKDKGTLIMMATTPSIR